jgi:hypothetical protein
MAHFPRFGAWRANPHMTWLTKKSSVGAWGRSPVNSNRATRKMHVQRVGRMTFFFQPQFCQCNNLSANQTKLIKYTPDSHRIAPWNNARSFESLTVYAAENIMGRVRAQDANLTRSPSVLPALNIGTRCHGFRSPTGISSRCRFDSGSSHREKASESFFVRYAA